MECPKLFQYFAVTMDTYNNFSLVKLFGLCAYYTIYDKPENQI